jgi:type I restriction enzyme M protein
MSSLTSDVPGYFRDFARAFDRLSYHQGDYSSAFCDFVDYLTGGLLLEGDKPLALELEKKYADRYQYFGECVRELLKLYAARIEHRGWFDGLGIFYEIIKSKSKSQAFGQYFTPSEICDLMAQLNSIPDSSVRTVMDPCAGSGRLLLATANLHRHIIAYGADLDPICVKMCAINMALHMVRGEVSCMNSLSMTWRFGYLVCPLADSSVKSIPHLAKVSNWEKSAFFSYSIADPEQDKSVLKIGEQLSLF